MEVKEDKIICDVMNLEWK